MTLDEFISHLDNVTQRGSRWSARCPAHQDRSPSLSISAGDKAILLRCWAGCSLQEICSALKIQEKDLFFDALDDDPQKRRDAAQAREQRKRAQADEQRRQGLVIDALKAADFFVRSRCGMDISAWTDQRLDDELNALADAYSLLNNEENYG